MVRSIKIIKSTAQRTLLDEAEIAVVFGEAFYMNGYLRISYANSMENIQEALRRMAEALKKLGRE